MFCPGSLISSYLISTKNWKHRCHFGWKGQFYRDHQVIRFHTVFYIQFMTLYQVVNSNNYLIIQNSIFLTRVDIPVSEVFDITFGEFFRWFFMASQTFSEWRLFNYSEDKHWNDINWNRKQELNLALFIYSFLFLRECSSHAVHVAYFIRFSLSFVSV